MGSIHRLCMSLWRYSMRFICYMPGGNAKLSHSTSALKKGQLLVEISLQEASIRKNFREGIRSYSAECDF